MLVALGLAAHAQRALDVTTEWVAGVGLTQAPAAVGVEAPHALRSLDGDRLRRLVDAGHVEGESPYAVVTP